MDDDDEFTGAGSRLAKIRAAIDAELKNKQTEELDVFSILGSGSRKPAETVEKSAAKKPSPPKVQKLTLESPTAEEVDEDGNEIILSSTDEEEKEQMLEMVRRKVRKENKNRANYFRMKEMDASFDVEQQIFSYLDEVNQKEFDRRMTEENEEVETLEQNYEMTVKVRWNFGDVSRFKIRRLQTFESIFNAISEMHNLSKEKIVLEFGEDSVRVTAEDTPDSLGVSIAHILDGYPLKESVGISAQEDENKGLIEIKVQLRDRRVEKLSLFVRTDENFSKLYCQVAEKLEVPVEKLRLLFEGDVVEQEQTAGDLDLEGGEVMDCIIQS
ncbi:DNA repair protein Rad60 [Neocloeon triangulifer]|uniref:DNA repair protein Rad60 n=1 Tax=Neocloeon triangulifer TaxID=2078957 RepID=UPI00286F22C3|nr:DNA repair protein Rad60 [Neocloeon triangulifer]